MEEEKVRVTKYLLVYKWISPQETIRGTNSSRKSHIPPYLPTVLHDVILDTEYVKDGVLQRNVSFQQQACWALWISLKVGAWSRMRGSCLSAAEKTTTEHYFDRSATFPLGWNIFLQAWYSILGLLIRTSVSLNKSVLERQNGSIRRRPINFRVMTRIVVSNGLDTTCEGSAKL